MLRVYFFMKETKTGAIRS